MGIEIFSGLAHIIKGGVFFWYGILTLGRWAGCFADIGWVRELYPLAHMDITDLARLGMSNPQSQTSHLPNLWKVSSFSSMVRQTFSWSI